MYYDVLKKIVGKLSKKPKKCDSGGLWENQMCRSEYAMADPNIDRGWG